MKKLLFIAVVFLVTVACEETQKKDVVEVAETPTEFSDSLGWINTQIIGNPSDPDLYMLKAAFLLRQGDLTQALEQADKAISLDSTQISFLVFKGDAQYDGKDIIGAKESYLKVLELDEKNIHANMKMGWVSLIAGLHEESFVYCNTVLRENQYLPEPYYLKGLCYKELVNFKFAVSNFRTATEQDNDYIEAWLQLGYMYDAADDTLAGAFFENALRIDSNNKDALYAFGMHLQNWGLTEEAITQYQHLIRVDDDYHDAFFNIGYVYLEQVQNYDSAIKYYNKVVALNPFNYKGYYNRGLAFERNNNMVMARTDFEKALELKADYTPAAEAMNRIN
mgnify:CR=1 FL=1